MADGQANNPLKRAPQVQVVDKDKLSQVELLCTPEVRTLLGYTRRILHLQDNHTLAVFSYSGSTDANWLFLIDSRDLSFKRFNIPNNDIASHAAALGSDGNIYIMPYHTNRAYKFDTKAKSFKQISVEVPEGEYTWEAFGASNGCIYFGTYPNACFGEYDTKTGKTTLWKQVAPNTKYVTTFSEDDKGMIHFYPWGPGDVWMVFDPKSRKVDQASAPASDPTAKLPAPPTGDQSILRQVSVNGKRFAVSFPSSRFWEIRDEKLVLCGDPKGPAESWFLEAVPGGVVGISHYGVTFKYDLKSEKMISKRLQNMAPGGNLLMFIEAISPECVIGANYSQQNLFNLNPKTKKIEYAESMIARTTGEPTCVVGFNGKAYIGIYTSSLISIYDPHQPFTFGNNPQEIVELGPRYKQTRPSGAATDGKFVYISSESAYNNLGGVLAVIDPQTNHVDVYPHIVKDQDLSSLAYDPVTKLIWGSTNRWGQQRSHPPTQESSIIYAFDPETRKVVSTMTLWAGSDLTYVSGVSRNGVLVAGSGEEIALVDTAKREVLYKGVSPVGVPSQVRLGNDGFCYFLADGKLYRWDLVENKLTLVANTPGCRLLSECSPGIWITANDTSIYKIKL
ncbi:MAG: hypothetical protein ABFD46_10625 [Armatimonadota bacterium]